MIFLYILEYLAIGFLIGNIGVRMDEMNHISNENRFILVSTVAWPLLITSFILGVIKGFYNQLNK